MSDKPICPPEHKPIDDDEIAWVVISLHRNGMGQIEARAVHLRDEGESHDVARLLARYGPTWMIDVADHKSSRYDADT